MGMSFRYLSSRVSDFQGVYEWARNLVIDLNKFSATVGFPVGGRVGWDPALAIPPGWLLCDGSSKLVADYKALYAVILYTYGGAGANFTLPTQANTIIKA